MENNQRVNQRQKQNIPEVGLKNFQEDLSPVNRNSLESPIAVLEGHN